MHLQCSTDAKSTLPALWAEFILEVAAFISRTRTDAVSLVWAFFWAIINCQFGSVSSSYWRASSWLYTWWSCNILTNKSSKLQHSEKWHRSEITAAKSSPSCGFNWWNLSLRTITNSTALMWTSSNLTDLSNALSLPNARILRDHVITLYNSD